MTESIKTEPTQFHPAFQTLTPARTLLPYRLADLFQYVADRQADAELMHNWTHTNDPESIAAYGTGDDAAACAQALEKLAQMEAAGDVVVYLDVTQDIPPQINAARGPVLR